MGSTYAVSTTAQAHDTTRCAHSGTETQYWTIHYNGHEWVGSQHYHYYTHYEKGSSYWHNETNECSSVH